MSGARAIRRAFTPGTGVTTPARVVVYESTGVFSSSDIDSSSSSCPWYGSITSAAAIACAACDGGPNTRS